MLTEDIILKYAADIKYMERLEKAIAAFSTMINPVKNLIRKDVYNADIYILEAIAILGKISKLSKSERDTVLNVIEFTIDEYEKWKSGETSK